MEIGNAPLWEDDNETKYYPVGDAKQTFSFGVLPLQIQEVDKDFIGEQFDLSAVTREYAFYLSYNCEVLMFTTNMEQIVDCDPSDELEQLVRTYRGILWMSDYVVRYQKLLIYDKPIPPALMALLEQIELAQLSKKERAVFVAYAHGGPIKYARPYALLAIAAQDWPDTKFSSQIQFLRKHLSE